jgi:hypothetical protein
MSDYDFRAKKKTGKNKGKIVQGTAMDDYFGKHQYGYRIKGEKNTLGQKTFNRRFEMLMEKEDEQSAANALEAFFDAEDPKEETLEELSARTFLVTDACMWEANRKNGTFHPHAIEVVDLETGQTRYIESGARIKFIEGKISNGRDQASYNEHHAL